jgi:ferrous iron transport protein B
MVIALNQVDLMEKKGLSIDAKKLEEILGVSVVIIVAIKGIGIDNLTEKIIDAIVNKKFPNKIKYGQEIEQRLDKLIAALGDVNTGYLSRWTAIKLIEKDAEIRSLSEKANQECSHIS